MTAVIDPYNLITGIGLIAGGVFLFSSAPFKNVRPAAILFTAFLAYVTQHFGAMLIPIGARLWVLHQPVDWNIWDKSPGRYFHSAALTSILFWVCWARVTKREIRPLLDALAVTILLVSAVGRLGCLVKGCCGGKICSLPWAVQFPNAAVAVHPTQVYMFLAETVLWISLLVFDRKKKQYDSQTFWLGVFWYSAYRILIECVRTNPIFIVGLTHAQVFSVLTFALGAFFIYFHRNPKRIIPLNPSHILAPADGAVISLNPETPSPFDDKPWPCISIFLSVWDVHINRSPVTGVVEKAVYKPGALKSALHYKNFADNESNWILLTSSGTRLVVRQIAGLLGRKIVSSAVPGQRLEQGEVFGRILLGSGTQVYLPPNAEICVTIGQKIKAGRTVVARLK